jgi:hypothetical protein
MIKSCGALILAGVVALYTTARVVNTVAAMTVRSSRGSFHF